MAITENNACVVCQKPDQHNEVLQYMANIGELAVETLLLEDEGFVR